MSDRAVQLSYLSVLRSPIQLAGGAVETGECGGSAFTLIGSLRLSNIRLSIKSINDLTSNS